MAERPFAVSSGKTSINGFLGGLANSGSAAMSNTYEVRFDFSGKDLLQEKLSGAGFSSFAESDRALAYDMLTLLCEEASLPGVMANTGQTTGVYMGEGQVNYPHTRSFQDITLGWTCDANLLPLKFLNTWMGVIFRDTEGSNTERGRGGRLGAYTVAYPDEYQCEIIIKKAERNSTDTLGRVAGLYRLHDAWPYSIQSTPVSYGASTLLKVTASFYYRRWDFQINRVGKTN